MIKNRKWLGCIVITVFMLTILFNYIPAQAAIKPTAAPKVVFVNQPKTEYTAGDIVNFDIHAPNYGGKVEYRVVLWNDSTKTYGDLWNDKNGYPNRYYTKWQPYGNNVFNLHWRIDEPGTYRITVYVKRAGIKNSDGALKGYNCDSFMNGPAFDVKPKLTGSIFDKEGQTYGSADSTNLQTINNDVRITAKNITLQNAKVEGNIYITGDNSSLNNVAVTGNIVIDPGKDGIANLNTVSAKKIEVLSGGKDSIHIKNVTAEEMEAGSLDPVRIEADGDTEIVATTANGYVIFDKKSGTFGTITITKGEYGEPVVEFRGVIQDKVIVETNATIKTGENSKIENLTIAANENDKIMLDGQFGEVKVDNKAKIEVVQNSRISNLELNAEADVNVHGATINTLETNARASVNLDKDSKVEVVEGSNKEASITGEGKVSTDSRNTGNNPGNPGGPSIPPYTPPDTPPEEAVNVESVTLDTASAVLSRGETLRLIALVLPTDASNKSIQWSTSDDTIAAVSNGVVRAIREGQATITATTRDGGFKASVKITVTNEAINAKVKVTGTSVTITVNSSGNMEDIVALKILDEGGNIKYIDQAKLIDGQIVVNTIIEEGHYKAYLKGIYTEVIEFEW